MGFDTLTSTTKPSIKDPTSNKNIIGPNAPNSGTPTGCVVVVGMPTVVVGVVVLVVVVVGVIGVVVDVVVVLLVVVVGGIVVVIGTVVYVVIV